MTCFDLAEDLGLADDEAVEGRGDGKYMTPSLIIGQGIDLAVEFIAGDAGMVGEDRNQAIRRRIGIGVGG